MDVRGLGEYIRQRRTEAQLSLRKLSSRAGVSIPYLSQIERGLRRPSAEILQAIAKGLRVSAETLYVQAGILEDRSGSGVEEAVMADPGLTERQRQALLQIYRAFRDEAARMSGGGETAATEAPRTARRAHRARPPEASPDPAAGKAFRTEKEA